MRAKEWSVRITHEAQMHPVSSFVTLTYAPEHLPPLGSLNYRDYQLFMYRLRKALRPKKIRYFAVGEYGDKTKRAHYHAVLFGYAPEDGKFHTRTKTGTTVYTSESLQKAWKLGHANFSYFEPGAAEYIARYITKKITGPQAPEHYFAFDPRDGSSGTRLPEFCRASTRPGIGANWYRRYFLSDVSHRDAICLPGGELTKVPRYYDKLYERDQGASALLRRKKSRARKAQEKSAADPRSQHERLRAVDINLKARNGLKKREAF